MLGRYGHSNLLYGYDKSGGFFYFFDPLYGGRIVKFKEVEKYLEAPIMKLGLSIGRNLDDKLKEVENVIIETDNFLGKIYEDREILT